MNSTLAWDLLNNHLSDPVRARIFFELMFDDNNPITIKHLQNVTKKERTTINHHLNLMISDKILVISAHKESHNRGKPTRFFQLDAKFLSFLRSDRKEKRDMSDVISDIKRNSSHLLMLGNIANQSQSWLKSLSDTKQSIINDDITSIDFPFYLYSTKSKEELKIYSKYLITALEDARNEINKGDFIENNDIRFVVCAGFVPVFRDSSKR